MAEQLSLFGSPKPEEAPKSAAPAAAPAQPEPAPEPVAAYASVVLDIPTRALSEPFAYGIPSSLANDARIGSTVLVHFGNRAAAGYIVDIATELADLQGNGALDPARIKPIEAILSKPLFTSEAARIARWM
ncbi:MAG: primosomal protein N', partial [Collinsella sp.]